MEISKSAQQDVRMVALAGRFDAQSAPQVDAALQQTLQEGAGKLLVDMARVDYISSAGLRVLLATAKKVSASGGQLKLCGLQPYVLEVFEVAGFTSIFQITPDAGQALAAF